MNDDLRAAAQAATPTISEMREALTVEAVRRLGVPKTAMSDFEIRAALERDRAETSRLNTRKYISQRNGFTDGSYDRRGLLNVLGFVVWQSALASPDRILALLSERDELRAGLERIATAMELGTYGVSREDIAAVARAALEGKPE